jgi:hypothetical protein
MMAAKVRVAMAAMGQKETKVADLCGELAITRQTLYRHVPPDGMLRKDGLKVVESAKTRYRHGGKPRPTLLRECHDFICQRNMIQSGKIQNDRNACSGPTVRLHSRPELGTRSVGVAAVKWSHTACNSIGSMKPLLAPKVPCVAL